MEIENEIYQRRMKIAAYMCTVVFRMDISPFKKSVDDCVKVLKRLLAISKDYPHWSSSTHLVRSVGRTDDIACGGSIHQGNKKDISLEKI